MSFYTEKLILIDEGMPTEVAWKISRIWSAGNCKKLTPILAQSHAPFIITYN